MIKKLLTFFTLSLLIFSSILANLNYEEILLTSNQATSQKEVNLPVLMYHGITENPNHVNEYFILKDTFEEDLKYLKEKGYSTITISQLIAYSNGEDVLPEKPVLITFDDGYCNNYNYAYPILRKYEMTAAISVIGSACKEASDAEYRAEEYCNMTFDQLEEISDSGYVEIGNHTYNLHTFSSTQKGAAKIPGESDSAYETRFLEDLTKVQNAVKKATGKSPLFFAWPYGALEESADTLLKSLGIKVTFTSYEGINKIPSGKPEALFNLKRQLRTPSASLEKLLAP